MMQIMLLEVDYLQHVWKLECWWGKPIKAVILEIKPGTKKSPSALNLAKVVATIEETQVMSSAFLGGFVDFSNLGGVHKFKLHIFSTSNSSVYGKNIV